MHIRTRGLVEEERDVEPRLRLEHLQEGPQREVALVHHDAVPLSAGSWGIEREGLVVVCLSIRPVNSLTDLGEVGGVGPHVRHLYLVVPLLGLGGRRGLLFT